MRSGSSAHDGSGWPSAHHPHQNEAVSGPGPYGPGPRSDAHDDQGGPYGPDISWPNGFRRLDAESQRLLESGYGTGGYRTGPYDRVDPRQGTGARRGYQQPAVNDYGYGDPGYSDPSYDGPRNQYTGPMRALGNTGPRPVAGPSWHPAQEGRDSGAPGRSGYQPGFGSGAYPLAGPAGVYTGAQEALPATGPQPIADYWAGRGPASASADPGGRGYSDRLYDTPRSGSRVPDGLRSHDPRFDGGRQRPDDPRSGGPRSSGAHAADPRLEGIRYDELRYDEPAYDDEPAYGGSRYDQPSDDVSWYEELRRSAPSYPERPSGPSGSGSRPADAPRHGDPRAASHGQVSGYPQAPARGGPARDDRGGPGPQMRAGREMATGPRPVAGPGRPPAPPAAHGPGIQDAGYREAPTVHVGVLTPPSGSRLYAPPAETSFVAGAGATTAFLTPGVRPGHGLDGPEITGSWPSQPHTDDVESFEDFWREDDDDEEYRGLFGEEDGLGTQPAASRKASVSGRRTGRRRGRSGDHRLWLALVGVLLAAAAAIAAIIKFEFPSHSGPAHTMVTPAQIGTYQRTVNMERSTDLARLRDEVISMSAGQATHVVSAVYASGNSAAGGTEQIIMFIGGHLANAAPATSIGDFIANHAGARVVTAGSLGGKAACVQEGAGTSNPVSMCVWFDNDSFGEIVSPTMNATALAKALLTVRPYLETVAPN